MVTSGPRRTNDLVPTIGTDQPLPGLARDNAIPVGRTLPGLLIDYLLRLHVALIEIDEDIVGTEEAELPQIAR